MIYSSTKESEEILRSVSMYRNLSTVQIYRMFPEKPETVVLTIIKNLVHDSRLILDQGLSLVYADEEAKSQPDYDVIQSFWVLLDFWDSVEYHSAGEYPIKISFFANQEDYDIFYANAQDESVIKHVLQRKQKFDSRKLIVIEKLQQIETLSIPDAIYCVIRPNGSVGYYKSGGSD